MKIIVSTVMYFAFFVIITQILPKIADSSNDYNIYQIFFLFIISLGIAIKNNKTKNVKGDTNCGKE